MKDNKIATLIRASLLAAMACVATMVIRIPSPMGGYMNLGDGIVLLSAFLLGPMWGAAAGGIGSMLADVFAGYTAYAPGTLAIKALMVIAAAVIFDIMTRNKRHFFAATICAGLVGEIIMVMGYFLYEWLLLGQGLAAASGIPGNLAQGAFGLVISSILFASLRKVPFIYQRKDER